MFDCRHLIGLPYIEGKQDCYSLVRRYYKEAWNIHLPNLARPTNFWEDPHLDLYEVYSDFGFELVFDKPLQVGDGILMPFFTPINTHAGVLVEPNQFLHHVVGRLSTVEPFSPSWSSRTNAVLRHPSVKEQLKQVHLHEVGRAHIFRDPRFQDRIASVLGSER
jgi:cell wall-associated NlpC family hydrolase